MASTCSEKGILGVVIKMMHKVDQHDGVKVFVEGQVSNILATEDRVVQAKTPGRLIGHLNAIRVHIITAVCNVRI